MGWVRSTGGVMGGVWVPYSIDRDVWGALTASKTNVTWTFSDYQNGLSSDITYIELSCKAASGYEGASFKFPSIYSLTSGNSYNLKFTLSIPSGITIGSNYQWGCKWSATNVTNFNTTASVNFTRTAGITEEITLPFTAGSDNYFVILLSALSNSNGVFRFTNIHVEDAT